MSAPQPKVMPRFEVEKLEGEYTKTKYNVKVLKPASDGKPAKVSLEPVEVTEPRGYMVYFPSGHSLHVPNEAELKRLGFDKDPTLVDLETGDEVEPNTTPSLKQVVQRATKQGRSTRPDMR